MSETRHLHLGCRLNAYESEAMQELANSHGLDDAVVINTCAVTHEAVRKSRQVIRRARRDHPHARLIATGCAVQVDHDTFEAMKEVDTVLGNAHKLEPKAWAAIAEGQSVLASDIMDTHSRHRMISGFGSRSRAHIQIQNGCDHRCTFCIIPYGRGNSRSVPETAILEQVNILVNQGFNEVVLSGVDITSWGDDLSHRPRLGELIGMILDQVKDLHRLRVSSVDPVELDGAFLEVLASEPRLMPHLHLSVQSGDDLILKRMKRRHLRDDVINLCQRTRELRSDISFGADLIAGFPTETEAMFEQTERLVEECGLTWLHVFPFSRRNGTPAARMPQVDGTVIRARAARLRQLGQRRIAGHLQDWVGRSGEVLMESPYQGRTSQFARVEFSAPQTKGDIVVAKFVAHDNATLKGVSLSSPDHVVESRHLSND